MCNKQGATLSRADGFGRVYILGYLPRARLNWIEKAAAMMVMIKFMMMMIMMMMTMMRIIIMVMMMMMLLLLPSWRNREVLKS